MRNHLIAAQNTLSPIAQIQDHELTARTLDGRVNHMAQALALLGDKLLALGVFNALRQHLLGGLNGDTVKGDRWNLIFDDVTGADARVFLARGGQGDLLDRIVQRPVGIHHGPAAIGGVIAFLRVDLNTHVDIDRILFLSSRS